MNKIILNKTNNWWQPKAGLILSAVYLSALLNKISFYEALLYFFPAVFTILGIGLLGHLVNDFFDKEADTLAGKNNILTNTSFFQTVLLFGGASLLAFLPWLVLPKTIYSLCFLIAEFILLIFYALPFIRVKERGFLALIFDALYAYVTPFFLAYFTFSLLSSEPVNYIWLSLTAFFWLFFSGIYNLAIHQLEDYENDVKTNTKTWVVKIGKSLAINIVSKQLWTLQYISFIVFCVSLFFYNFILGSLLLIAVLFKIYYVLNKNTIALHFQNSNVRYLQFVNIHYHRWLPYLILAILSIENKAFILLFFIHAILFHFNRIVWFYNKFIKNQIWRILSLIANYSIYYFRVVVLRESKAKARRNYQEAYAEAERDYNNKKIKPNIVIANQNQNKYTETFVAQHVKMLQNDYYTHVLYGANLPYIHHKKGPILGNYLWVSFKKFTAQFFDDDFENYKKKKFTEFLSINDIQLVLAEFGTVGVEIHEMCREANVPLLVVFYGYDAHHIDYSPKTNNRYQGLFNYASKIICVSKDIQQTLVQYGAPSEKLVYLPCAFDIEKFAYTDHSKNPPIFLSVGRFAETKSPHLTILAFNEVLKEIPGAQLRMIGKDGGGELFEACHILVKALKIEDKVSFLGIQTPEQVYEEMKNARVFVQHSVTTPLNEDKEGTPVSVMEALACGLPVVATLHAGIEELIVSGENGILVEEYYFMAMAEAMVKICKSDALVFEFGKNGSESIRSNILLSNNTSIFLDIVNKLI